jgi:hypothetical protein
VSDFLSVAGTWLKLVSFVQKVGVVRGEAVRAFDNTLLDGTDAGKREWDGETVQMTLEGLADLRTATQNGPVAVLGPALLGETVLCKVTVESAPYGPDVTTGTRIDWTQFNQSASLTFQEV